MPPAIPRARGAGKRVSNTTRLTAPRPKAQLRPRILVLQLDSENLKRDGLSLGTWTDTIRSCCIATEIDADITVIEATSVQNLAEHLASAAVHKQAHDVLVTIGHGNETGVQLAEDLFVNWQAFAAWVRPLRPRKLVMINCYGGRWLAARTLFLELKDLRRIFASPVGTTLNQARSMVLIAMFLCFNKRPNDRHLSAIHAASLVCQGGQLRQWLRKDMDDPEGLLLDQLSSFVDPLLRTGYINIANLLERLLRS